MKRTFRAIRNFIKKEWFLLVTGAAVTLIIVLFELLA